MTAAGRTSWRVQRQAHGWVWAVGVVTVGLLAHASLLRSVGFRTRDHIELYLRVGQYASEFLSGHWPQTLPDAIQGGGHAFPLFYPPLAHLVAAALHLAGLDLIAATHAAAVLSVVLSGLLVFVLLRRITGSLAAAFLGAAFYLVFPYRHQLLEGRGSLAEAWALVWLPLLVVGTLQAEPRRTVVLSVGLALLILSHSALAPWIAGLVLVAATLASPTGAGGQTIIAFVRAGVVASGLVLFYVLPVLLGAGQVNVSDGALMRTTPADVAGARHLFGALPGPDLVGWLATLGAIAGLAGLVRRPALADPSPAWQRASLAGLLLCAAALAAPSGAWHVIPAPLRYLQSPVRLLGPVSFLLAVLVGVWASQAIARRAWGLFSALGLAVLGAAAAGASQAVSVQDVTARELAVDRATPYFDRGLTLYGDYLPQGTDPVALSTRIARTRAGVGVPPLLTWTPRDGGYLATIEAPPGVPVPLPLVAEPIHELRTSEGGRLAPVNVDGQLAVRGDGQAVVVAVRRRLAPGLFPGAVVSVLTVLGLAAWAYGGGPWSARRRTR